MTTDAIKALEALEQEMVSEAEAFSSGSYYGSAMAVVAALRRAIATLREDATDIADSDAAMAEAAVKGTRPWREAMKEQSKEPKVAAQYVCDARYSEYANALVCCSACGFPIGRHQQAEPERLKDSTCPGLRWLRHDGYTQDRSSPRCSSS